MNRSQQTLLLQVLQRRRVLRKKDVGFGVGRLHHDLVGERVLVVETHFHIDPSAFFERGYKGLGRLFVLATI